MGRTRVERARRVIVVEFWTVDRLLQIHAVVDMVQKELRRPLVLAVAAWGTEGHPGLAVFQRERRRQRAARALARRDARRRFFVEPGDLQPRAEAEAKLGDNGR